MYRLICDRVQIFPETGFTEDIDLIPTWGLYLAAGDPQWWIEDENRNRVRIKTKYIDEIERQKIQLENEAEVFFGLK